MKQRFIQKFFVFTTLILIPSRSMSAAPVVIQVATIIPDGTGSSAALRDFSKAVVKETNGEVNFKFIWGGNAGTDDDVLSQIKTNKLQGALIAGPSMDHITSSVRSGEVPFQFGNDRSKVRSFVSSNRAKWDSVAQKNGFQSLGYYEAGFVYFCSKNKIEKLSDIAGTHVWLWPGDKLGKTIIEEFKAVPTEVGIQDSLKAFTEGKLDAAYGPAIAIVALQWYSKAKNILLDPISFATGSFIVDSKIWSQLTKDHQNKVLKAAANTIEKMNASALVDETESLDAIKSLGVQTTKFSPTELKKANDLSSRLKAKLKFN